MHDPFETSTNAYASRVPTPPPDTRPFTALNFSPASPLDHAVIKNKKLCVHFVNFIIPEGRIKPICNVHATRCSVSWQIKQLHLPRRLIAHERYCFIATLMRYSFCSSELVYRAPRKLILLVSRRGCQGLCSTLPSWHHVETNTLLSNCIFLFPILAFIKSSVHWPL